MPTKHNEHGFTLTELLIATVIIAVAILGWAKAQQGTTKNRAISNGITTASELGMAKLEELALQCQSNATESENADSVATQGVQYDRTWAITQGEILDGLDLWQINVEVTWDHFGQKSVQYQRIVVGN
ncbi:type IV pilus modification PilV family protein [Desulfomicrobium salsuginis]